ncbi:energy-coupling factor ABC transporter ATP-binding protein [Candidatus Omnitrophota bacterium]
MAKKAVEIRGLSYSYPDRAEALKEIDLDVFEEESLGIIGPNGAGKTTLLLHLNGILAESSRIRILGEEMTGSAVRRIRPRVGLVFQDPDDQLFMPTVFDDCAFGPINMGLKKEEVREHVREALEAVGMRDLAGRLAHHLSSGEKKRISIATVLSMKPEILVLDEPSSNLDPRSRRQLIDLLKGFRQTRIIACHDLEMILELCSRVVLLDDGRVAARGLPEEILSNKILMRSHSLEVPASLRNRERIYSENSMS